MASIDSTLAWFRKAGYEWQHYGAIVPDALLFRYRSAFWLLGPDEIITCLHGVHHHPIGFIGEYA